ncbi:MAG: cell filamentation protein Fic, partial [Spirochaetae bacterium HGW-Spirochaetae-10]
MQQMLKLNRLREGIRDLLTFLSLHPFQVGSERSTIKVEGTEALHYVALAGPLDRGRFIAMTGLGERTGRR